MDKKKNNGGLEKIEKKQKTTFKRKNHLNNHSQINYKYKNSYLEE